MQGFLKAFFIYFSMIISLSLVGCESTYYKAMEKVGIHKREILVDRIEDVQKAQVDSKEQFVSALDQLKALTDFEGGELEATYNRLKTSFEDSEAAAKDIHERINKVESVADHLFAEWEQELNQYTSERLKRNSQKKLQETQSRYSQLLVSMRNAEKRIDPVLNTLRDHVLYLKHNLNAQAIASLKTELGSIKVDVDQLIVAMEKSISESDAFIKQLSQE